MMWGQMMGVSGQPMMMMMGQPTTVMSQQQMAFQPTMAQPMMMMMVPANSEHGQQLVQQGQPVFVVQPFRSPDQDQSMAPENSNDVPQA